MCFRHLAASFLLLFLLAGPAEGQLRGVVRDPAGAPLADVVVEVWSSSPTPAGMRTDRSGGFRVTGEQLRGALRLSFRRIGYQSQVVDAAKVAADSVLAVTLAPDPVLIEGITVRPLPERAPCPNREQPAARRAWEAARARYAPPPPGSAYRAMMLSYDESVEDPAADPVPEERMHPSWKFWVGDRDEPYSGAQPLEQRVRERGYAWELPWRLSWYRSFAEEFFAWNYVQLFTFRADHFASDEFGRLHTLSLVRDAADGVVIAFCPVRRNLPSIQGRLRITRDSSLAEARWSYRTPRPNEDAGGEVTFRSWEVEGQARPLLAAERSTFWRRQAGRDRYVRHSYVFLGWEVGPEVRSWNGQSGSMQ
ncbi:MAG TPA: carboxypeptidase-like regulatory domain-containing protein [Longimicrobiaceae bacterium]|jgi:hypothetical protein